MFCKTINKDSDSIINVVDFGADPAGEWIHLLFSWKNDGVLCNKLSRKDGSINFSQTNETKTGKIYNTGGDAGILFHHLQSITELEPHRLLFCYSESPEANEGDCIQMRNDARDNPSVFLWECRNTTLHDIHAGFLHSFGIVGQLSTNITLSHIHFRPFAEKGTLTGASADMVQMSGCDGTIRIHDCEFFNPQDDPINIHGTFLKVIKLLDRKKILVAFTHPETYGFLNFHAGDEMEITKFSSMRPVKTDCGDIFHSIILEAIPSSEGEAHKYYELTLDREIPTLLQNGNCGEFVVENITRTPEVYIERCFFRDAPVRGILCTTRKPIRIEGCHFENINKAAVFLDCGSNDWHESGRCEDVRIYNNTFVHCGFDVSEEVFARACIVIGPVVMEASGPVHSNITIEKNDFYPQGEKLLKAYHTNSILFENNRINVGGIDDFHVNNPENSDFYWFSDCQNVSVCRNVCVLPV